MFGRHPGVVDVLVGVSDSFEWLEWLSEVYLSLWSPLSIEAIFVCLVLVLFRGRKKYNLIASRWLCLGRLGQIFAGL